MPCPQLQSFQKQMALEFLVVQDAIAKQKEMFFLTFLIISWPKLYYKLLFFTGKLFYLDTDIGGTGCYCKPEWNVYYWKETNECFEQESPGPCPTGQYFAYNSTSRSTECNCFKNFVYDPTKGIVFQLTDPIIIYLKYAIQLIALWLVILSNIQIQDPDQNPIQDPIQDSGLVY